MVDIVWKDARRRKGGSEDTDITAEEISEWQTMRPFVARALTLNHELAGPLAGILGYLEFLSGETKNLTDEQKQYLDNIVECTESMCGKLERFGNQKAALSEELDIRALVEKYALRDDPGKNQSK